MKRFPFGLTITAALAFAILVGLGGWQMHRLTWKLGLLAKIAALRTAPSRSLAAILAASRGADLEFARARVDCSPAAPSPGAYRYALRDGAVGWRLMTPCRLAADPGGYDGIVLDRGLVERFTGAMAPAAAVFAAPAAVIGVMRAVGAKPLLGSDPPAPAGGVTTLRVVDRDGLARLASQGGLRRPIPYILAVESEAPPLPGVHPAALPQDIPNNHFVYALTWYALAGILAWFYGAMMWRRRARR